MENRNWVLLSSIDAISYHPDYQAIIALGLSVVPLILEDLQRNGPGHWFRALHQITGEDIAVGADNMVGATEKVIDWGRKNNYIQ